MTNTVQLEAASCGSWETGLRWRFAQEHLWALISRCRVLESCEPIMALASLEQLEVKFSLKINQQVLLSSAFVLEETETEKLLKMEMGREIHGSQPGRFSL